MESGTIVFSVEQNSITSLILEVDKKRYEKYFPSPVSMRLISGGGSDRRFYRIKRQEDSIILMISSPGNEDFKNYIAIARFLEEIGIGVPKIYDANLEYYFLFMEDVGDESLYRAFQAGMSEEETFNWYKKVVETLAHMQVEGWRNWVKCLPLHQRKFDYQTLRWETEYFQKYFLEEYCKISIPSKEGLAQEFKVLAEKVAEEPLYFMHRDFQSQNTMLHKGEIRILDFQGGRKGLLQYDLASLLKDAYIVLSERTQKNLIAFYLEKVSEQGIMINDFEQFYETFVLAGLQRNMQALGAFSYLSLVKGKLWFQQYIPAGAHHLHTALQKRSDFPFLSALVGAISQEVLPS
ncbi:MAG: phosphotransferase [Pseudomonadota bacterium]